MNGPGKLIKDGLRRKGRSQSDLAKAVGVGRQAVSKWVKGGAIGTDNLAAVAAYLGLDPVALIAHQTGYKPPTGDFLTPEAQAIARRFQTLSDDQQQHIRWLVDSLAALSSPRYQEWEQEQERAAANRVHEERKPYAKRPARSR